MKTLVAFFADAQTAQAAIDRLMMHGFRPDNVRLHSAAATIVADAPCPQGIAGLAGFDRLFSSLFAHQADADPVVHAESVRHGTAVVTIDAMTETDFEHAQRLVNDFKPMEVTEDDLVFHQESQRVAPCAVTTAEPPLAPRGLRVARRARTTGAAEDSHFPSDNERFLGELAQSRTADVAYSIFKVSPPH
jgi:hypothetical protein